MERAVVFQQAVYKGPVIMHIVMVSTSYPRFSNDSAGCFVADAAHALAARGHAVTIIAPASPDVEMTAQAAEKDTHISKVRIRRVAAPFCTGLCYGGGIPENMRRSPWRLMSLPFFIYAMRRAIAEESVHADVIHAHWSACGWMAIKAARQQNIPLVVTLHGSDLHARLPFLRHITKVTLRVADRICAVSEELQKQVQTYIPDSTRTVFLPNGVHEGAALPASEAERRHIRTEYDLPVDRPLLLFVGRLVAVKQVHLLLDAMAFMHAHGCHAALAIVGDGPERLCLERRCSQLGLAEHVSFLGPQHPDVVRSFMRAADALTLCSASEGRPIVLLEALAEGLPVVAHAVGGIPELVDDGLTGCLVPSGDAPAYAQALMRIMTDTNFRTACASAARQAFHQKCISWPTHAQQLEAIYRECLASPNTST